MTHGDPAAPPTLEPGYWRRKTLHEMSMAEWEALCDGCGKCCLLKLEDEDTGVVWYTDVVCRLFDPETCRCTDYANRKRRVPECMVLTPEVVHESKDWMPRTCAYRLIADGYDLYPWHPLMTGEADSTQRAGASVKGETTPEAEVPLSKLLDHIIGEHV